MSKMPSIAETVGRLLAEADAKTASELPGLHVQGGYRTYDPKVAAQLRKQHGSAHVDAMMHAPITPPTGPMAVHKAASALRDMPEPELNYDILHVVKTAMVRGDIGPLPLPEFNSEEGSRTNAGLRKLANELRVEDHEDHSRLLAKGAHVLKAGRGVMLLRELVRE